MLAIEGQKGYNKEDMRYEIQDISPPDSPINRCLADAK